MKTILAGLLLGCSALAQAGWILVGDEEAANGATNPGYIGTDGGPANQNPETIDKWLEDLLNDDVDQTFVRGGDVEEGATFELTGLDLDGINYIVLHYGNDLGVTGSEARDGNNTSYAYVCDGSDCDTFTPVSMKGLSNYRLFNGRTVPEPGTLGLLALGMAGLVLVRRRQR